MTYEILRANAERDSLFRATAESNLCSFGSFYEHNTFTSGVVYQKDDLESFLAKHGKNPFDIEEGNIKNWADELARQITPDTPGITLVFKSEKSKPQDLELLEQYSLYDVYIASHDMQISRD